MGLGDSAAQIDEGAAGEAGEESGTPVQVVQQQQQQRLLMAAEVKAKDVVGIESHIEQAKLRRCVPPFRPQ